MGTIRNVRTIASLLEYVEQSVPDARIGNTADAPVLWLPAPDGYAVWIAVHGRSCRAVVSRRTAPERIWHQEIGKTTDSSWKLWTNARTWFQNHAELSVAWRTASTQSTSDSSSGSAATKSPPSLERGDFWMRVADLVCSCLDEGTGVQLVEYERIGRTIEVSLKTGEILRFFVDPSHRLVLATTFTGPDGLVSPGIPPGAIGFTIVQGDPVSTGLVISLLAIVRLEGYAALEGAPLSIRAAAEQEAADARGRASLLTLALETMASDPEGNPAEARGASRLEALRSTLELG